MKYIIDFDGVIFNTEALKKILAECGIEESERTADTFDRIKEIKPEFEPISLVYPNARKFLEENKGDCLIVSSYQSVTAGNNVNSEAERSFQMAKIEASGIWELVEEQELFLTAGSKLSVLQELHKQYSEELIFVDDRKKYLDEAKELGIRSVWMDREEKGYLPGPEGVPAMLNFPRVGNFAEFTQLTEEWKREMENK